MKWPSTFVTLSLLVDTALAPGTVQKPGSVLTSPRPGRATAPLWASVTSSAQRGHFGTHPRSPLKAVLETVPGAQLPWNQPHLRTVGLSGILHSSSRWILIAALRAGAIHPIWGWKTETQESWVVCLRSHGLWGAHRGIAPLEGSRIAASPPDSCSLRQTEALSPDPASPGHLCPHGHQTSTGQALASRMRDSSHCPKAKTSALGWVEAAKTQCGQRDTGGPQASGSPEEGQAQPGVWTGVSQPLPGWG